MQKQYCKVGLSKHRFFCDKSKQKTTKVLLSLERRRGPGRRYHATQLGRHGCIHFPTRTMLQSGINRIAQTKEVQITLIAPVQPRAVWFPDLLSLLVERPVQLPLVKDLITQPLTTRLHGNLAALPLHAWRLSPSSW